MSKTTGGLNWARTKLFSVTPADPSVPCSISWHRRRYYRWLIRRNFCFLSLSVYLKFPFLCFCSWRIEESQPCTTESWCLSGNCCTLIDSARSNHGNLHRKYGEIKMRLQFMLWSLEVSFFPRINFCIVYLQSVITDKTEELSWTSMHKCARKNGRFVSAAIHHHMEYYHTWTRQQMASRAHKSSIKSESMSSWFP